MSKKIVLPLHQACKANDMLEVENRLTQETADLNETDEKGHTPLHLAALYEIPVKENAQEMRSHHLSIIKILFEKGAPLSARNSKKQTPLHLIAIKGRKSEALEFLLQNMSVEEINEKDAEGCSALDLALNAGNTEKTAPLLIQYGAELTEERIQRAVNALARTNLFSALIAGGFGESACPIESVTDIATLIINKLKDAGVFQYAAFGVITLVSGGIAILGASLFFIATAYREKHLNYGTAAQKNLELRLRLEELKKKNSILEEYETVQKSIESREKKLENWNNQIQRNLLSSNIENDVKKHTSKINNIHKKLITLEKRIKTFGTTGEPLSIKIPDTWQKFKPAEDLNTAELSQYATTEDIVTAIGIGLGKGFGYFSATAGAFAGIVMLFGFGAIGGPIGMGVATAVFIMIGLTVGYLAYKTTRQEFGKKNQMNHRLMLEFNKEVEQLSKRSSLINNEKKLNSLYEKTESLCEHTITAIENSEKLSSEKSSNSENPYTFFQPVIKQLIDMQQQLSLQLTQ